MRKTQKSVAIYRVEGYNRNSHKIKENGEYIMPLKKKPVTGMRDILPAEMQVRDFVMSQIKIDMVWFQVLAEPISYVWSISLTLLSAVIVDFVFYFRLDKINMAEALKSVE